MMSEKEQTLERLRDVFNRWEALLAGLREEEITATDLPDGWSIKDVMAHLWAWQQRTLARHEAALNNREPHYPAWPDRLGPDPDVDADQTNEWIYQTNRDKPWASVYADWRGQFLRILGLAEQVPEKDLVSTGRFAWMEEYPLIASLQGSCEHHEEHLGWLVDWLRENGSAQAAQ